MLLFLAVLPGTYLNSWASDQSKFEIPEYVSNSACAACHIQEFNSWSDSDHAWAMRPADDRSVLGDFSGTTFSYFGDTSRFFKRDGRYLVTTAGPDGEPHDYEIKYTFGIDPLQQYLIEFPGGRLQSLSIAWDTRPETEGGQRWFHLYPDQEIQPGDPLHWTGPYQNWNGMCAECHSTNLVKAYDATHQRYQTHWSEVNVSCQACHGPGSAHLEWARQKEQGIEVGRLTNGLLSVPLSTTESTGIEGCARCHARRRQVTAENRIDRPFLDNYLPATLRPGLYFADGQIQDEVYVYGSFLQSRMHQAGVVCADCHDPHSAQLKASGNAVCTQCHQSTGNPRFAGLRNKTYDGSDHHFHPAGSAGAQCVNCHMPARTYMLVDPRRDHSFRIPRPDLSAKLNSPNACNQCHTNQSASWAASTIAQWYGPDRRREQHYGEVFALARSGDARAIPKLIALLSDLSQPAIVRATAVAFLTPGDLPQFQAILDAAYDQDPLIQASAIPALNSLPPRQKAKAAGPLLEASSLAVRTEAARVLGSVSPELLSAPQRLRLKETLNVYRATQLATSDVIPGAHLNLAVLAAGRGQPQQSEQHYLNAIALDPYFLPARINLGNLYNALRRNREAVQVFRDGIVLSPDEGELHYSLGLILAEEKQLEAAVISLARASELLPDRTRVHYNHALALQHLDRPADAESALTRAYQTNPEDPEVLQALVILYAQQRKWDEAIVYARQIVKLFPNASGANQTLDQLLKLRDRDNQ